MKDYNRNGLDLFRLIATVQVFFGHVITHSKLRSRSLCGSADL